MNGVVRILLVMAMVCSSAVTSQGTGLVAAADQAQAVLQADHALAEALKQTDPKIVGALLDEKFVWTDVEGKTRSKTEALESLAVLATNNQSDTDLKTYTYSQLAIVFGFHHNARFARIWVKRQQGWRAFLFLDTPVPKQAATMAPALSGIIGDCENPCRVLPFTPTTEADQAVVREWQKTKMDEWHPDVEDWETHLADEFLIINSNAERNKVERVAIARKQQAAGLGVPGDPVLSMSMLDFEDAVAMISHHAPYRGGKPYYNVRVFVNRNGHWLLAWSQQTTIQTAASIAPVGEEK